MQMGKVAFQVGCNVLLSIVSFLSVAWNELEREKPFHTWDLASSDIVYDPFESDMQLRVVYLPSATSNCNSHFITTITTVVSIAYFAVTIRTIWHCKLIFTRGKHVNLANTLLTRLFRPGNKQGKQSRKRNKCEAKWISLGSFAGMAEVVKFKGNHLKSTGIVRDSRVLLHVEEIGYLMQKEALTIQDVDFSMTIMDIYTHLMTGEYGCSWDAFKVYLELKTLGYIVGRHNVLWSMKSRILENSHKKLSEEVSSRFEMLQLMDESRIQDYAEAHANSLPDSSDIASCGVHMHEDKTTHQGYDSANSLEVSSRNVELMFDVFPPNSSFKKTNPGNPDFSLCVSSDLPPDSAFMEALKTHSKNIPVTIATVDSGRVSFFHFNEVQLPHLP